MNKIRCAVIGVGYLGRFHAQKYAASPNVQLIAVCDTNQQAAQAVAQELQVPAYTQYSDLFGQVDAVSIAASTRSHFDIAKAFLEQGIHVLIEKPITETTDQAAELIKLAQHHQVKIQVGHLERFNPARLALDDYLDSPLLIESERLAPFNPRGADVNVVLDLMIHDIDLIQNMIKSPIVSLHAQGTPILTQAIDIANARITFANGCVANLSASRCSNKAERLMRIVQSNGYLSVDYQHSHLTIFKKGTAEIYPGVLDLSNDKLEFPKNDALLEEIKAFIKCIEDDSVPLVTGEDGMDALDTAEQITALIHASLMNRHEQA